MMHRFFVRIAIQAGFSIVERNLSSYSLASFSSRWYACTHDVMMGLIDICPTGAQQTPNRMQMAQFTSAIMASNMRLMVRSNPQTLSWDIRDGKDSAWLSFAKPFTYGLWTAIIGLTVFTGLALAFLEGAGGGIRCRDGRSTGTGAELRWNSYPPHSRKAALEKQARGRRHCSRTIPDLEGSHAIQAAPRGFASSVGHQTVGATADEFH